MHTDQSSEHSVLGVSAEAGQPLAGDATGGCLFTADLGFVHLLSDNVTNVSQAPS